MATFRASYLPPLGVEQLRRKSVETLRQKVKCGEDRSSLACLRDVSALELQKHALEAGLIEQLDLEEAVQRGNFTPVPVRGLV